MPTNWTKRAPSYNDNQTFGDQEGAYTLDTTVPSGIIQKLSLDTTDIRGFMPNSDETLAAMGQKDVGLWGVWSVDLNGNNRTRLDSTDPNNPIMDGARAIGVSDWSPDDEYVLFSGRGPKPDGSGDINGLFLLEVGVGNPIFLASGNGADWSPYLISYTTAGGDLSGCASDALTNTNSYCYIYTNSHA